MEISHVLGSEHTGAPEQTQDDESMFERFVAMLEPRVASEAIERLAH